MSQGPDDQEWISLDAEHDESGTNHHMMSSPLRSHEEVTGNSRHIGPSAFDNGAICQRSMIRQDEKEQQDVKNEKASPKDEQEAKVPSIDEMIYERIKASAREYRLKEELRKKIHQGLVDDLMKKTYGHLLAEKGEEYDKKRNIIRQLVIVGHLEDGFSITIDLGDFIITNHLPEKDPTEDGKIFKETIKNGVKKMIEDIAIDEAKGIANKAVGKGLTALGMSTLAASRLLNVFGMILSPTETGMGASFPQGHPPYEMPLFQDKREVQEAIQNALFPVVIKTGNTINVQIQVMETKIDNTDFVNENTLDPKSLEKK